MEYLLIYLTEEETNRFSKYRFGFCKHERFVDFLIARSRARKSVRNAPSTKQFHTLRLTFSVFIILKQHLLLDLQIFKRNLAIYHKVG